ncbi:MAG: molybdopterin dinucleotide-binding protein [Candidatus Lokiarchaeota archaeon]|nr:molybdopterin dinucleotide-binding protein [Candidatus Lokiarchaeota archaeon]
MSKIKLNLTSGATIDQGVIIKGGGKGLPIYTRNAGLIFLDPSDLKKLDLYPMSVVKVSNELNEVIVYAQISPDAPHPGLAFMPRGPWANTLIRPETYSSGAPMYKNTEVWVESVTTNAKPMNMPELMKHYYLNKVK